MLTRKCYKGNYKYLGYTLGRHFYFSFQTIHYESEMKIESIDLSKTFNSEYSFIYKKKTNIYTQKKIFTFSKEFH